MQLKSADANLSLATVLLVVSLAYNITQGAVPLAQNYGLILTDSKVPQGLRLGRDSNHMAPQYLLLLIHLKHL